MKLRCSYWHWHWLLVAANIHWMSKPFLLYIGTVNVLRLNFQAKSTAVSPWACLWGCLDPIPPPWEEAELSSISTPGQLPTCPTNHTVTKTGSKVSRALLDAPVLRVSQCCIGFRFLGVCTLYLHTYCSSIRDGGGSDKLHLYLYFCCFLIYGWTEDTISPISPSVSLTLSLTSIVHSV
jgi:hypothetical protein